MMKASRCGLKDVDTDVKWTGLSEFSESFYAPMSTSPQKVFSEIFFSTRESFWAVQRLSSAIILLVPSVMKKKKYSRSFFYKQFSLLFVSFCNCETFFFPKIKRSLSFAILISERILDFHVMLMKSDNLSNYLSLTPPLLYHLPPPNHWRRNFLTRGMEYQKNHVKFFAKSTIWIYFNTFWWEKSEPDGKMKT